MIAIATEDGVRTPEALGVSELGGHSVSALAAAGGTSGRWWTRRRSGAAATGSGPRWPPTRPGCAACCPGTAARSRERPRRTWSGSAPARWSRSTASSGRPAAATGFTPWGGHPAVRTIAAGAEGELYVNVHVGGILRSDDDGASWRPTIDIRSDVHEVLAVPGAPRPCAGGHRRRQAATSEDGGVVVVAHDGLAGAAAGPWRSPGTRCC